MQFFWVTNQARNRAFDVQWHTGQEHFADYSTKYFESSHHQEAKPWYSYEANSPRLLPRAAETSALRGCVENLPDGYSKTGPLPRVNPIRVNQHRVPLAQLGRSIAASTWHKVLHAYVSHVGHYVVTQANSLCRDRPNHGAHKP